MLFESLPAPPTIAEVRTTNVWIIEWLSPNEQPTGRQLHEWIEDRRTGWSVYHHCINKAQVIQAIERATVLSQQSGMVPVLHLEAHGGDDGLAPDNTGRSELLTWEELTDPLQQLNLATQCNLVVVVAACTGFAGIQAFRRGPRAPAVALVGPDASVTPGNLLSGAKEFYRRWMDENPKLGDIASSASQEAGTVAFEWEPFAILAYEALVETVIKSARPAERLRQKERIRKRLVETGLPSSEIEHRFAQSKPDSWKVLQQIWDQLFMIDLYPGNQKRFGIDMKAIVARITANANGNANGNGIRSCNPARNQPE